MIVILVAIFKWIIVRCLYFLFLIRLNMEKNKWNPWFGEFWESYFNCKMPTKNNEENKEAKTIVCDQGNKISKDNGKQ